MPNEQEKKLRSIAKEIMVRIEQIFLSHSFSKDEALIVVRSVIESLMFSIVVTETFYELVKSSFSELSATQQKH